MSEHWKRLSALLDELFDLDAASRAARLAEIDHEDVALANELRRLLAADERSGLLDAGVVRAAPTIMSQIASQTDSDVPRAQSGKRIGHYRLVERVGSGGMGDVWRAERVDDFEQAVAIKLIRPLLDSPQLRERFARERRILARLDHPNIARLLDGGVSDDGTPWYAMEFVRGEALVRHADAEALDVRARIELLLQVCDAVAHAHSHLVVHRDLKPSNILVDTEGRARVLDFGIARLLDESADATLTGTGVRVFSPSYAAPEQIRGETVGTAADVFALGAVLYELLTGQVPHPKRSAAPDRLIAGLALETAPRPSDLLRDTTSGARNTRSTRELTGDLDTIVATALQPDAPRRYAGAAQLADDLRRWLDGRPVAAQPDTAGYRMRKFVARHRIAVGSASAVLLALIAGLGLALWQANVARQHAARADAEAHRANAQALLVEAEAGKVKQQVARVRKVKDFLVSVFVQTDPMRRTSDGPLTLEEAFDATLARARTELSNDPVLQADVFDDFGEIRSNQGRFDEARGLFDAALAVAEREFGPDHPAVAETLLNLGALSAMSGDLGAAKQPIERAVAILEKNDGGDPLALANATMSLAAVRQQHGDLKGALEAAERALTMIRKHGPDGPMMIPALTNVGIMASNADQVERGEALLLEAVQTIETRYGKDSINLWPALSSLADVHFVRNETERETAALTRGLDLARSAFPGPHPWTALSLVESGFQKSRLGDWAGGEPLIREGIAMYEALESPELVSGLRRLAIAQTKRDDTEGALESLERAWVICGKMPSINQICTTIRANRAKLLARTGRADEALREADAALAWFVDLPGLQSERGQAMEARAGALAALGRQDEALAQQDEVVAMLQAAYGPEHTETKRVVAARARMAAGRAR